MAHGSVAGVTSETKPAKAVNISQQARLQRGDVAKALAESDVVIEKTYRVPMVHQGYSSRTRCWPSGTAPAT